jgi:DNA invertase Pin-like site-specific DNA recombinase
MVEQVEHAGATRAAIYARISDDKEGEGLGVERQIRDCLDLCERLGWTVKETYRDDSKSAYSGKARPAYERMLRDARAGRINAIACWSVDRLTRHPRELEDIIDLHTSHGVALATFGGEINLGDPDGRTMARLTGAVARGEVEKMGRRIRREVQQRAERGLPHGQKAYGWDRVDGEDALNEAEAAVVREIAQRLLSGESVKAVTDSLNARVIPPPYGHRPTKEGRPREWSRVTVRAVVLRERNAGLRRHQGKIIGRAAWKPIFDEETYHRLHALLSDPLRKTTTGSAYRYLLTGIAKCGKCSAPVRVILGPRSRNGKREKRRAYVCSRCHGISRDQPSVDHLIERLTIEFLASPKARPVFSPEPDALLIAEANRLRAKLEFVAGQFARDEITGDQLTLITGTLRPKLQAIEAEIRPSPVDLSDLATPDIAKRWKGIPLERRRAVVDFLWDITLLPRGKDALRRFDPESIRALPKWKRAEPTEA